MGGGGEGDEPTLLEPTSPVSEKVMLDVLCSTFLLNPTIHQFCQVMRDGKDIDGYSFSQKVLTKPFMIPYGKGIRV